MKFRIKGILLGLFMLFSFSVINAQEERSLPIPPVEDEWECGLTDPPLVQFNVLVWSSKKGYLKDLTYKDFEVYDEKELQDIEYFTFDESTNQYVMGFSQKYYVLDNKWHNLKVKIKLSAKKKKDYGKISVLAQKGYYPENLKSKT